MDPNMFTNILKQVKTFKDQMQNNQSQLASLKVEAEAGAGLIKIIANGLGEVSEVQLDDSVLQEDKKIIQGLLIAAMNALNNKLKAAKKAKMQEKFAGLGLPEGLDLNLFD